MTNLELWSEQMEKNYDSEISTQIVHNKLEDEIHAGTTHIGNYNALLKDGCKQNVARVKNASRKGILFAGKKMQKVRKNNEFRTLE